jgi:branched-chain amino acid transport system permease protein
VIARWRAAGPAARAAVVAVAWLASLLVLTQVVLPGDPGPARGTPVAILLQGVVRGLVVGLSTAGIVLVYRTFRILNFAQTVLGLAGAFLFFGFVQFTQVPFALAFPLGVVLSGLTGAAAGVVVIRFLRSSRLVLTVVTAVASGVLVGIAGNVYRLPFFPDSSELTIEQLFGAEEITRHLPFAGLELTAGGHPLTFGFADLFAVEIALVLLVALGLFLRYTRTGAAVRALAENPERAALLGIGVPALVIVVWTIVGVLGGVTASVTGMLTVPGQAAGFAPAIMLTSFGGAVLGRMERLAVAVAATVSMQVVIGAFQFSYPGHGGLVSVGLFAVLFVGLLAQRRSFDRVEQSTVAWAATQEQRAVPHVLAQLPPVRAARWGLSAAGLVALVVVPFVASTGFVSLASVIALSAIIVVSLVVLTGWGGQLSLGQWGFAAVGAIVSAALTSTVGVSFWIAVPVAAAVTGGIAVLVGLPALRIRGLFLLVVTAAFAYMVQSVLFDEQYFDWLLPDEGIERPTLLFLDFSDETSMYFLCVGCLVASMLVVANLRKSRVGRILIALRENEADVQAFGVPLVRSKLLAFGVSGTLAGFAGAVFVHQQTGLNVESFGLERSINAFSMGVIGGIGSVTGALLGTAWFSSFTYFFKSPLFVTFLTNGGVLFILFAAPGGFVSIVTAARDSMLRVVAQRRQIVVPSLFADVDPEALENRLIPLADVDANAGLAAIGGQRRWSLGSYLYRHRDAALRQLTDHASTREHAALRAAAGDAPIEVSAT